VFKQETQGSAEISIENLRLMNRFLYGFKDVLEKVVLDWKFKMV